MVEGVILEIRTGQLSENFGNLGITFDVVLDKVNKNYLKMRARQFSK